MVIYCFLLVLLVQNIFPSAGECLKNYVYQEVAKEWNQTPTWKTHGKISLKLADGGLLKNWQLQMTFTAPLAKDIESWKVKGIAGTAGKTTIILNHMDYNNEIDNDYEIDYIVAFKTPQGTNHLTCVQFCGTLVGDSNKELCSIVTQAPVTIGSVGPPSASCDNAYSREYENNDGYNGEFKVNVPVQVSDWVITFTVDRKYRDINPYTATKEFISPNTYKFKSRDYNGRQSAGTTLSVKFSSHFNSGEKPNILSISFGSSTFGTILLCGSPTTTPEASTTLATTESTTSATTPETTTTSAESTTSATTPETTTASAESTTEATTPETTTASAESTTAATTPETTTTSEESTTSATTPETTTTSAESTTESPACKTRYNYSEVLEKSLLFYEAQRSGKLPANQRVKWRKDSALQDGSDVSIDLTGGYYDAGDFVKFGFPMAAAITNLAWGMIEFKKGYTKSSQVKYGLAALKWGTDYFIKCHTSKYTFYGQVGDGGKDHAFWGRPEDMTMDRPSADITEEKGGSELAGETAAALAASSIVFRDEGNAKYADLLLKHAVELYDFAKKYPRRYDLSITDAANFYKSYSGYKDELAWSTLWLYKATGDETYATIFKTTYNKDTANGINEFSWDNKWAGVQVLAARLKITTDDYLMHLKSLLMLPKKTPKGLFFVQKWGSNRHAANLALLALISAKVKDASFYEKFARGQIHYMLGDSGRSYVVGFGNNPPQRPHHKSSSCPTTGTCDWNTFKSKDPNAHVLNGALVGGPDSNDQYADDRTDYIKNEVTLDYNAGFQSAIAALIELSIAGKCE